MERHLLRRLVVAALTLALGMASAADVVPAAAADAPVYFDIPNINGVTIHACRIGRTDQRPKPVVLEWTGYNIDNPNSQPAGGCPPQFKALASELAGDGYIYIAGQVRGVGGSTGNDTYWSLQDGKDGAAVVEWLAAQPWSTGKVGVVGCSNSGIEAMEIAVLAPPHLAAVSAGCIAVDSYRDDCYPGGLRNYSTMFTASRPLVDTDPQSFQAQLQAGSLGWIPAAAPNTIGDVTLEAGILSNNTDGPFWRARSTFEQLDAIKAPVLMVSTWDDFFLRGTFEWERHRKPSDKLVMLPGWHGDELNVPGPYGMSARAHDWFDHYLRGRPDRYTNEPQTVYWELDQGYDSTTGRSGNEPQGRYRAAASWPPPATQYKVWTFGSPDSSATLTYPSGSMGSTTDPRGFGLASMNSPSVEFAGNIVTFTTKPLAAPMHLSGPVTADIWLNPTAVDMDLYVRLLDMAPDGTFRDITNGWLKGSFAALDSKLTLKDPATGEVIRPWHPSDVHQVLSVGTPVELSVELWETAAEVPAGHSLRVFLSAQDSPWFLQDTPPGSATVLTDAAHPSRIVLPVSPRPTQAPAVPAAAAAGSGLVNTAAAPPPLGWKGLLLVTVGLVVACAPISRKRRSHV